MKRVLWRLVLVSVVAVWGCQFLVSAAKQEVQSRAKEVVDWELGPDEALCGLGAEVGANLLGAGRIYVSLDRDSAAVYVLLIVYIGLVLPGIGAGCSHWIRSRFRRD